LFIKSQLKKKMLKVSSAEVGAHMDMSDHGLLHTFKGPQVVANDLTGMKNGLVKNLFILN